MTHLLRCRSVHGAPEQAINLAIEVAGAAHEDALTHQLIEYLMGDVDGIPKVGASYKRSDVLCIASFGADCDVTDRSSSVTQFLERRDVLLATLYVLLIFFVLLTLVFFCSLKLVHFPCFDTLNSSSVRFY